MSVILHSCALFIKKCSFVKLRKRWFFSSINGTSKQRRFSAYQQPSVHHSLDPIIAADREKEIEEECANVEDNESQQPSKPTEVPSQPSVSSGKK